MNLITNAIDSMAAKDEPRVLWVKSDIQADGAVKVSVADTGTGIGSQEIEQIFNPLFTTKSDGMGMGLSICRSIIEDHKGRLWVEVFEDGENCNALREPNPHQAFGNGPHHCAGAHLSRRTVGDILLPMLFERFPNMKLPEPSIVRWYGFGFRGPLNLPVILQ
jgi:hypothetical protein